MKQELIKFLRELADGLEKEEIEEKEQSYISEFFMKYKFMDGIMQMMNQEDKDKDEIIKYFSLGWYIYTFLLKKTGEMSTSNTEQNEPDKHMKGSDPINQHINDNQQT